MWNLYHKEYWALKNWCSQTVVLEKTLEKPLDNKEIKQVNLKGNWPWILLGRTNAEAKMSVFWSSNVNNWLIGKVPDAGKDWGQKEKRASEDEMAGWHHWCNGHEPGKTLGDGEEQRSLACCSPWGHRESDITGLLNNNNDNLRKRWQWCPMGKGEYFKYIVKKVKVKSLSCVQLFAIPWTVAHQAPLSIGFSRQEYWSGLPFPSPGDLPNPGIKPRAPALQADALTSDSPGKP